MRRVVTWILKRDPESGWYVGSVAELPGCYTQGKTLPELRENMAEALEVYMETCEEDGPLPDFVGIERVEVVA